MIATCITDMWYLDKGEICRLERFYSCKGSVYFTVESVKRKVIMSEQEVTLCFGQAVTAAFRIIPWEKA